MDQAKFIENLKLIVAIGCAISYGITIAVLLWSNPKNRMAWYLALGALLAWPMLFFMGPLQLIFVLPLATKWVVDGRDVSKPISTKAACWAIGITVAYLAMLIAVGFITEAYLTNT